LFETTSGGNGSRSMKLVEDPAEQTTAVTDIILALVAFGGVLLLQWSPVNTGELWRINIWSMALGLVGLAAALGTVAHGLFLKTTFHNRIWLMLNMALALAVSLFVVGVTNDLWSYEASRRALPFMLFAGLGFYLTTLIYPDIFFLFIVYEGLALSFAFCAELFLTVAGRPGAGFLAGGVMLSLVAAGLQARKSIAFTLIWKFDNNGIYHIVQTLGLLLIIAGLKISLIR
jgi:hypothetical protein